MCVARVLVEDELIGVQARVHEALCLLLRSQHPSVAAHVDPILSILASVLSAQRRATDEAKQPLTAETMALIGETVRSSLPADRAQGVLALL